jgi:hypothetical protein
MLRAPPSARLVVEALGRTALVISLEAVVLMNMTVEILVPTDEPEAQKLAGTFVLRDGKIVIEPGTNPRVMNWILNDPLWDDERRRKLLSADDPERWMRLLPKEYNGSRTRARLVED